MTLPNLDYPASLSAHDNPTSSPGQVRRRRSQAAAARHKGDTTPVTRLPRTSAHSHDYNAPGVVLLPGKVRSTCLLDMQGMDFGGAVLNPFSRAPRKTISSAAQTHVLRIGVPNVPGIIRVREVPQISCKQHLRVLRSLAAPCTPFHRMSRARPPSCYSHGQRELVY